jgi:hypothetical protein
VLTTFGFKQGRVDPVGWPLDLGASLVKEAELSINSRRECNHAKLPFGVPPPQSEDLNAPQLSVIRTTPYNSCYEENAHAHKTKRGEEKGDSDAEIKVGWQESSKKEPESRR